MEIQGNVAVVVIQEKRLDARLANDFKKYVQGLVAEGYTNLLLDLGEVQFVDSSGLGALVSNLKSVGSDGELELCSVNAPVQSLLKLTRLDRVFTVYKDRAEALGVSS